MKHAEWKINPEKTTLNWFMTKYTVFLRHETKLRLFLFSFHRLPLHMTSTSLTMPCSEAKSYPLTCYLTVKPISLVLKEVFSLSQLFCINKPPVNLWSLILQSTYSTLFSRDQSQEFVDCTHQDTFNQIWLNHQHLRFFFSFSFTSINGLKNELKCLRVRVTLSYRL